MRVFGKLLALACTAAWRNQRFSKMSEGMLQNAVQKGTSPTKTYLIAETYLGRHTYRPRMPYKYAT